jgi:hypothetical protein
MTDEDFPKYTQNGYWPSGRYCDKLVERFIKQVPADGFLPLRWKFKDITQFTNKYAHLGTKIYATPASYHLLLINGHYVCRIWTDSETMCQIDIASHLDDGTAIDIPAKNVKKCKPLVKRLNADSLDIADRLAQRIKRVYGI